MAKNFFRQYMKPVQTLVEELKYNEAMLQAYDGEDKEVRETLRSNIRVISDELKRRGYLSEPREN